MRNKMIKISTRVMAAVLVAASVLSISTPVYAAENTAIVEEVAVNEVETVVEEAPECEMTVPETEGQGDIIDDEFAYVEGQGDVIDDEFAVAPEAEVQPATESLILIEAPVIDVIMNEVEGQGDVIDDEFAYVEGQGDVIDDEFAVDTEVEGQGDVIDDEFAVDIEVEGQGDVIDDEFAYVEGQGDVIDDEFAVTPEAEDVVEAVEVAENDTEVVASSVNSFVAVGSADSLAAVGSADSAKNDEEYKSELTKNLEEFNKGLSPLNVEYGDPIRKKVNDCDFLGDDEKEYINEIVTTALSTGEGVIFGEYIPGFGAFRKAAKMVESVSKALDASDANKKEDALKYTVETFTNGTEAIVSALPGGGLVVAGAKVQNAIAGYCAKKVTSFFKWLF